MLPAVLFFASVLHWPPVIPGARPTDCKIYDGVVYGQHWWHLSVTLTLPDGTEKAWVFSDREFEEGSKAKVRKKVLLDCNDFMTHYEKQSLKEGKRK